MTLIDTHQHLIHNDLIDYHWTASIPALAHRIFTARNYSRDLDGRAMAATIFMECDVDEADLEREAEIVAAEMAAPHALLAGQIASCRPERDAGFEAWLDRASALGVVGFRRVLHVVPDAISRDSVLRRNLKRLGRRGFPFDMCFFPRQLAHCALELVRDCDEQTLVLDHCGCPDIAAGDFSAWARDIASLASYDHVFCKLSGLTAYCAPGQHGPAVLRPWFQHALDCFGPDRMLWGSDWPVVNLGAGLSGWIDITSELLAPLSPSEREAICSGTARRVYRLGDHLLI